MEETTLLQNEKNRFLADEFFMLSWAAATQHNKTWTQITEDSEKSEYRQRIKNWLEAKMLIYAANTVQPEDHCNNIVELSAYSKENGEELDIGKCQKLLNMMCKYYWCAGWILTPPDIPIDSINLSKIGKKDFSWTKIPSISIYEGLINDFKNYAESKGFNSVAVWELASWKRRQNQKD